MTDPSASFRRILRSSAIIGSASVVNIGLGMARTKALAVLLGPAGVGLASLYIGLLTAAATVASLGVGTVGTRQVAEALAKEDAPLLAKARRAMLWGAFLLAAIGASVVWFLRDVLALQVFGVPGHADNVGWLAIGVALSVIAASQGALIQGLQRIGDIARITVLGGLLNTVMGLTLLWLWGSAGLIGFVLMGPLASYLLGCVYVSRLPATGPEKIVFYDLWQQWRTLISLGAVFMAASLVGTLVQLWIRISVSHQLGAQALGHYQAAWMISMQYIGFVLGAMAADYYPRLSSVMSDHQAASNLVNQQTEIALLLATPVFISMMGLAPWVIQLLYSAEFSPAVEVLRWQILGDVLKVASWPLGFVMLAAGDGKMFFWTEVFVLSVMSLMISLLSASFGLQITGVAFVVAYVCYLPLVYRLAKHRIGFKWNASISRLFATSFAACLCVGALASVTAWAAIPALALALGFAAHAVLRITAMSQAETNPGRAVRALRHLAHKLNLYHHD